MPVPNNSSGQSPPPVPRLSKLGFADPVWARWLNALRNRVLEAITSVNIASANGFVATVSTGPNGAATITLSITASGILKGVGGAIDAAVAGTDYIQGITATLPLNQSGGAVPNISMTQSGISSDGWLSSVDWNTFNNKLSGTGVAAGTYTKVTVASSGLVTAGAQISAADVETALGYVPAHSGVNSDITSLTGLTTPLSVPQGGTGLNSLTAHAVLLGEGTGSVGFAAIGAVGRVLTDQGAGVDPVFAAIPNQPGKLLNIQELSSTATYTKTTGTLSQIVDIQAPGAGGGGTGATGTGQSAAAAGGGAGSFARIYIPAAVTGVTVTLPAGSAGGAAGVNAGTAGSTASFGTYAICPGGLAGGGGTPTSTANFTGASGQTALPTVGAGAIAIALVPGGSGNLGTVLNPTVASTGGRGGGGAMFPSTFQDKMGSGAGINATVPGQGGGGANQTAASAAAEPGGSSGGSYCVVYEFG